LSSHSALLPPPVIEGVEVFPVFFLRHPVDRLSSAYRFERQQAAETYGARLAKEKDFPGYVRTLLDHTGNRSARNYYTYQMAFNEPPDAGAPFERAARALDALPFVGLVEKYNESVMTLTSAVSRFFPNFDPIIVRKNAMQDAAEPLEARLVKIAAELGQELYGRLCESNADDFALFDKVRARYKTIF
jgi:hypothetical protein